MAEKLTIRLTDGTQATLQNYTAVKEDRDALRIFENDREVAVYRLAHIISWMFSA